MKKRRFRRIPKLHRIHREGVEILIALFAFLVAANMVIYFFFPHFIFKVSVILGSVAFLFVLNFFRSPRRMSDHEEDCVVAPADGKIVVIEPVEESEYFHDKRMQVSIFMSVFNVHVNWVPIGGLVKLCKHHKGRFQAAYLPKSSMDNERSTIVIESDSGEEIMMRQVAGALARRIVTYAKEGTYCDLNNHIGFIKFGSRVDLFLPMNAEILVEMDQFVFGNKTVIAKLKPSKEEDEN